MVQVLLVFGELAPPFAVVEHEVAGLIGTNATVAEMKGAGYPARFEQPAAFADLLTAWFEATPVASAGQR